MRLALALICLIFASPAWAAETVAPQAAQSAMPQGAYLGTPKDSYQLFLFGDTLADGVLDALKQAAEGDALLRVDGRTKDESGLARPEIHDWAEALPKIQDSNQIDIAAVMIGVNDSQPLRDGDKAYLVGTPEWKAAYGARVDRLIGLFKARGTALYWLGLPPMGSAALDANAAQVSALQKERAAAAGVKYIELRAAAGIDWRRLQKADGVNLTPQGNGRVAAMLLDMVRADVGAAFGAAESAGLTPEEPQLPENATPLFGQLVSASDGVEAVTRPAYRPPSTVIATDEKALVTGRLLVERLTESTTPGSAAEALFMKGIWPQSEPGRVDDFSIQP